MLALLLLACSNEPKNPPITYFNRDSGLVCFSEGRVIFESTVSWERVTEFPTSAGPAVAFQDGPKRVLIYGAACVAQYDVHHVLEASK